MFNAPLAVDVFVRHRTREAVMRWTVRPPGTPIESDEDRVIVVADSNNRVQVMTVWRQDRAVLERRYLQAADRARDAKRREHEAQRAAAKKARMKGEAKRKAREKKKKQALEKRKVKDEKLKAKVAQKRKTRSSSADKR
mmetsp:Transcript_11190/g.35629  ORF Transcript_11190/g.35629 Transcript_11190/m.35629 type:complete len:139 (+) Transcript_11190:1-417(+)